MTAAAQAKGISIPRRQARAAIRLLGKLQDHLESSIETSVIDGETEPREEIDKAHVRVDRRAWRAAESLIGILEGELAR